MKKSKRSIILCLLLAGLSVFIACGLICPLGVTEYEVHCEDLPAAFEGYRILQISDLQNSSDPDILPLAQQIRPDIIVLTGDTFYHDMTQETLDWTLAFLKQLSQIAPVYSVSGNHDRWHKDFDNNQILMAHAGVINLENAEETIKKDGNIIHIMGISDPDSMQNDASYALVQEFMQHVPSTDGFDILLFHRANMLDCFRNKGFELILSGHIHGGQIRLPFLGGLESPEGELFPHYDGGLYLIDETTTAVVSRGIGNTVRIPRFYNAPELVLVTLQNG